MNVENQKTMRRRDEDTRKRIADETWRRRGVPTSSRRDKEPRVAGCFQTQINEKNKIHIIYKSAFLMVPGGRGGLFINPLRTLAARGQPKKVSLYVKCNYRFSVCQVGCGHPKQYIHKFSERRIRRYGWPLYTTRKYKIVA